MVENEPTQPTHPIIDAHLDLAYNAVVLKRDLSQSVIEIREQERQHPPADPEAGICMVSWPDLLKGGIAVVGGSIFVEPARKSHPRMTSTYHTPDEAREQALAQLEYYRRVSDEREDVTLVLTELDLETALTSWGSDTPSTGVFVVLEGADPILHTGELGRWVEQGVRGVGLTWSAGTRYAGGNANPGPLTDEGMALLKAMADYHLLLDISHLWEAAVYQVLDRYPGPIVATHANPRAFFDSPRALSDTIIHDLADRGGVVGIIAYNRMLNAAWRPGDPRLPLTRLAEALDHVCQLTGHASAVGIGSDLDGGFGLAAAPDSIASVADLHHVGTLLIDRGYAESDVQDILCNNWLRVMRQSLEVF